MKPNNRRINTKPKVRRPKPKKISTKPRKPKRPNPKKFRAVNIGKGVKRPKAKSMRGIAITSKIKDDILDERTSQKQDIAKLSKKLSKLKSLRISLPGLQELSDSSIKKIQQERLELSREIKELSNNISESTRRLAQLETKYKKQKS
ncbi:MAG: hypothetical protein R3327_03580 [Nitrosopumilaceae archaeon]|nr:hypothetical protein [Nitrosopumilaceae archaeon]